MRALVPTTAACLLLSALAGGFAGGLTAPPNEPPDRTSPTTASVPSTAASTTTGTPADNEAAAKHAKRTACLKTAKAKKLVGAQKTAFIKDCVAAPSK